MAKECGKALAGGKVGRVGNCGTRNQIGTTHSKGC